MDKQQANVKWWVTAGVGALIGAAVVWYNCFPDVEEGPSSEDLLKELEGQQLHKPVHDENGQINTQYFLKLLQFIGQGARDANKEERIRLTKERRVLFTANNDSGYKEKVKEMIFDEEKAMQLFLSKVVQAVDMEMSDFEQTHQRLASNQRTAEYVMAAQQGKLSPKAPMAEPSLDKKQVTDYLEKSQRQATETMAKMKNDPSMNQEGDQMAMMVNMMTQQARLQDELFVDTTIEHDDFEENLMYYMTNDKEIAMKMQTYMMQMRQHMGQ